MKINIHHEGESGWVQYDPLDKDVMVSHPNELVRNTVRHYLNNERRFTVPASNDPNMIGHRKFLDAKPVDSKDFMDMGLTEMFHETGVHVNWGHKDNIGSDSVKQILGNDEADKPIVKSLLDDKGYEIIN